MKNVLILISMFLICSVSLLAQDFKFGKVSKAELDQKFYPKDSTADAAVLFRKLNVKYEYVPKQGFKVVAEVFERIKIYNKKGFKYATISEPLYQTNGDKETLSGLKAYTFNNVNGSVEKFKLKSSDVVLEKSNKFYNKKKFTMPNVKEGSVLEIQYKLNSPFAYNLDEIDLQYNIPIAVQEIKVQTPEYFVFKPLVKGHLSIIPKVSSKNGQITFAGFNRNSSNNTTSSSHSSSTLDYIINIAIINSKNIPALKDEPFVNNINNYRSAIKYELQYVKFPQSTIESYTTNWEKVVKTIYKSSSFGEQLKKTSYFKKDLLIVLEGKTTEAAKLMAVYNFVKSRMNWNSYYGYRSDEGVKKAYDLKTGNVADINLMLVAMLREAGLDANPVLVSTRNNGVPLFPTMEGFNYVVAAVKTDNGNVFLDATNKFSKPNMLPTRTINWAGRLVKKGGVSTSVSLIPTYQSKEVVMLNATINEEGEINGKARRVCKDYVAYVHRNKYSEVAEESYLEKMEEDFGGIEISDYSIKDKNTVGKLITESFSFYTEDMVETIGDKMYFSPLLWFAKKENPFKLEKRNYPIDFTYPWHDKFSVSITIPDGYKIESIPENISVGLEGKVGVFLFNVTAISANKLQIASDVIFNKSVISAQQYQGIKELYKTLVEKQSEKIVLSKI